MTRTVGLILMVVAVGVCVIGSVFLVVGVTGGGLEVGGAVLGFGLMFVFIVAPLGAGGVFAVMRGKKEESEEEEAKIQRKILDMVKTHGQVDISEIIIELQSSLPEVKDRIYRLVGMGVFSGYINWDEGVLYSEEASAIKELDECRNCGGQVDFAGKGVLKCPYCGTEYFIS